MYPTDVRCSPTPVREYSSIEASVLQEYLSCAWDLCTAYSVGTDVDAPARVTCFHSVSIPNITLADYVVSICRRFSYDRVTILFALVLARRYWRTGGVMPSRFAAHRLFATLLLVASKLRNDSVWRNVDYARVCGLSLQEVNGLEVYLLNRLDHRILVQSRDVDEVCMPLDRALRDRRLDSIGAAFGVAPPPVPPPEELGFTECSAELDFDENRDDSASSVSSIRQGLSRGHIAPSTASTSTNYRHGVPSPTRHRAQLR